MRLTGIAAIEWAEKNNEMVCLEGTEMAMTPSDARELLGMLLAEGADGSHGVYADTEWADEPR